MGYSRNGAGNQGKGEGPRALAELARLRQGAYRLFSQSLLYPDQARLAMLATVAQEIDPADELWARFAFAQRWGQFLHCLRQFRCPNATAIQSEYVSLFLVSGAGVPCPIYESAYLEDDPIAVGWLLAQLEREYRSMGLSLSPTPREPPDHVAVELEFMAFLCAQEAEAWEEEDLPKAFPVCHRERTFLERHLAWWVPTFVGRVVAQNRDSVFAAAGRAASAFLIHDGDLLDALLQRFQGVMEAS